MFYQLYKQEVRYSDSQEMAGAVGAAAGRAMEEGERGGGQPQADSAGGQGVEGGRGVVGDHVAFHKGKVVGEVVLRRIYQLPYSPELNPAERVFEAVRRWVEGRRYERIEAKKAAVEGVPRWLEAEERVSSLVGWRHIRQALNALPS
jgi:transposase